MTLLHTLCDTFAALYTTDPLVVAGGLASLLVFAYGLLRATGLRLVVRR